jgi:iron complex transport system substrate-binding protein
VKRNIALFITLLILITCTACSKNENSASSESITVTDMAGRTVTLEGPVDKVTVSEWSIAEIIFAVLGEEGVDKLAAVGSNKTSEVYKMMYSEKFPQLASMPDIGGGKNNPYDTEAIIATEADVFILQSSDAASQTETIEMLEKAGIKTIILNASADPIQGPQDEFRVVGKLFGAEDKAQIVIDFINAQFDLIRDKNLKKPTVYIEKGSGSSDAYDITFTSGQWATIIDTAGGDNIAVGTVEENTQIDPEYLLSSDPDYIIIVGALGFGADANEIETVFDYYANRIGWNDLQAVKENRVYTFAHGQSRSPLSFYPTLYISKLFYPDEFADVDPDELLKEYIEKFMLLDYDQGIWFDQINN